MGLGRSLIALGASAFLGTIAATARAEDAEAERLVKEGHELLERGQVNDACDRFDLALKREDSINTLALLAFCHERAGKPGRAWNEFKRLQPRAPTGDKAAFVAQHLKALETKVARARLDVGDRTISEVRVDNEVVVLDQGKLVTDPGEHTVRVEAGGKTLSKNTQLKIGENAPIVLVDSSPAPVATPPIEKPTETPPASDGSGARTAGWILAGVGVVLVGVGTFEGVKTLRIKSDADALCGGSSPNCKDPEAKSAADARRGDAIAPSWIATFGIGLGAAAIVTGAVLIVTSGPSSSPPPPPSGLRVRPEIGLGSLGLRGVF